MPVSVHVPPTVFAERTSEPFNETSLTAASCAALTVTALPSTLIEILPSEATPSMPVVLTSIKRV